MNSIEIEKIVHASWTKISPLWPINDFLTINPLHSFADMGFNDAIGKFYRYFAQPNMPAEMHIINEISIKWLQVLFDNGQAGIKPCIDRGLLAIAKEYFIYDNSIINHTDKKKWLQNLSDDSQIVITDCLNLLNIPSNRIRDFCDLQIMLLPGWSSYALYYANDTQNNAILLEYIAIRLIITYLVWPEGKNILDWYDKNISQESLGNILQDIKANELRYQDSLLNIIYADLANNKLANIDYKNQNAKQSVQMIFCIDVRSEPIRQILECNYNYDTYGAAGFFNLPINIIDNFADKNYISCPTSLDPDYDINIYLNIASSKLRLGITAIGKLITKFWRDNCVNNLFLIDVFGLIKIGQMLGQLFITKPFIMLKNNIINWNYKQYCYDVDIIALEKKTEYAKEFLQLIGLIDNFASIIVICGHNSSSDNHTHLNALQCGACSGRSGFNNAIVMTKILNDNLVRQELSSYNIDIPVDTYFVAACHDTAKEIIQVYEEDILFNINDKISVLRQQFQEACQLNIMRKLGTEHNNKNQHKHLVKYGWQMFPDHGLANNAGFIIGPRWITKKLNLSGRSFLHSYDYNKDQDFVGLNALLSSVLAVVNKINNHYLFSYLDQKLFNGISSVNSNIVGNIGIIKESNNDIALSLPTEMIATTKYNDLFHNIARLSVFIYAPKNQIKSIILNNKYLCDLVVNQWIYLLCLDPATNNCFILNEDLNWLSKN